MAKVKSHATNGANVVSVVLIVSEMYCRQYQEFRMLTYSTEQVGIFARTGVRANNNNLWEIMNIPSYYMVELYSPMNKFLGNFV